MIRFWHIALFAIVLAAAAAAFAPARLFIRPGEGEVSFSKVDGTIWKPVLKDVRVGRVAAGDVAIVISGLDLLLGRLAADASINGRDVRGALRFERGFGGDLRIRSPSLVIDGGLLAGFQGLSGATRLANIDIVFADRACRSASGHLESDALALAAAEFGGNGPTLAGEAACEGALARLQMAGERDSDRAAALLDLGNDGTGNWSVTYATSRPEMAASLIAAGLPPETQAGVFTSRGTVRWLPF